MFADELRRAAEGSPRADLHKVAGLLWKAYAAGTVTEAQASELSEFIEARKAIPPESKRAPRRTGSRPRSSESMERRRKWAASGRLPPQIQSRFTLAEAAVLSIMAAEIAGKGACTLTIGHIAALAGVCNQTVRNAMREAAGLGFIRVEERRLTAWRNAPNRVTILSAEWLSWLRLRPKRGGSKCFDPTATGYRKQATKHSTPSTAFARRSEQGIPTAVNLIRSRLADTPQARGPKYGR